MNRTKFSFCSSLKPLRVLMESLCVLILVLFSYQVNCQDGRTEPYSDDELSTVTKKINQLILDNEWTISEELIVNMTDHYKIKGIWDSVYHYNALMSEVAHQSGNFDLEMRGYLSRVSQDRIFRNVNSEEHLSKVMYIAENIDTNRLSYKIQTQAYESHASYLVGQSLMDSAVVFSRLALLAADKSGISLVRITSRLQYALKLQNVKRYEEELNVLLEAERIADSNIPDPVFSFRIYKNIGGLLMKIDDLDKAEYYIERAIFTSDEAGYSLFRADAEVLKARILARKGEYDKSIIYFNKAIEKYKEVKYFVRLPGAYERLADMEINSGNLKDAKASLDSSVVYARVNSINYKCTQAKYNLAIEDYSEVKAFLDSEKNNESLRNNYSDQYLFIEYKYYKGINAHKKALEKYESYTSVRDSIEMSQKELKVHRLESEFNRDKQDLEINNLNQINAAQDKALAIRNTALIMGTLMLLILGGLLFGLYRLYKRDQENQKELAKQNKQISEALAQNKLLIKEIHHRVKNNLQVVSSLLNMQARKVTDGDTKDALNSSKTRVQSMSILHQNLYQGDNLTGVNIEDYLQKLVENIVDTYNIRDNIKINIDIDPISLDVDTLVPLGLVANELICNALKYAFEGRENGVLDISFKAEADKVTLRVADNGVGFDGDELPIKKGSLGARLIRSFSERLEGKVKINKSNGTDISIEFDKDKF